MPSLLANVACFERPIAVASLSGLVAALARALGQAAVGGADLERLLVETIEAECVCCGITLAGADLIATSLGSDAAAVRSSPRLARVRLGYCARKTCASGYYVVRFAPWPNIDWREVWTQVEPLLTAAPTLSAEAAPPVRWWNLIPDRWIQQARKPVPILVASALALAFLLRGGCRVPGLSPKPRVFIVSDSSPTPAVRPVIGQ